MPNVLCYKCGIMFEVDYDTIDISSKCTNCNKTKKDQYD